VKQAAFAFAVVGLFMGQSAFAADMPVKARPAPPPAVANWTGWYAGVHIGGSFGDSDLSTFNPIAPGFVCAGAPGAAVQNLTGPFDLSMQCNNGASFIGGGQIGYTHQFGAMVLGIEADGSWRRITERSFKQFGNTPTAGSPMGSVAGDTTYLRTEQDELGTIRGRIGYAPSNWMVYATGGFAAGHVRHSYTEVLNGAACVVPGGATCRNISGSGTQTGWTAGAGAEMLLGNNWSVAVEYLYVDLGTTTLTLAALGPAGAGQFFFNPGTATFEDRSHIARIKLNYRWSGLVLR
jgi:outer membrane immunogenic protein